MRLHATAASLLLAVSGTRRSVGPRCCAFSDGASLESLRQQQRHFVEEVLLASPLV